MTYEFPEGKKILIVEDDLSSRLYLNKILEKTGIAIFNAGDGQEAFNVILNNPDIDIVLMDIQLPVMDGYITAKKMRSFRKELIIIAQTSYSLSDDKEKIMNSGFDDYLTKPIFAHILIEKLTSHLSGRK